MKGEKRKKGRTKRGALIQKRRNETNLATHVGSGDDVEKGSVFLVESSVVGDKVDVVLDFEDGMTRLRKPDHAAAFGQDFGPDVRLGGVGGSSGEADEDVQLRHQIVELLHRRSVAGG